MIIRISLLIIILYGCSITKHTSYNIDFDGVVFNQGDKSILITQPYQEIELERKQFSIDFEIYPENSEYPDMKISAVSDENFLDYFKEGNDISSNNPFLEPGSGLACRFNEQYSALFVSDYGAHYIYYKDENDKRAELLLKKANGKVRLRWTINNIASIVNDEYTKLKIKNSTLNEIYLMLFVDVNMNEIIEKGEYNLVKLTLI